MRVEKLQTTNKKHEAITNLYVYMYTRIHVHVCVGFDQLQAL
jgi:hypothetical protein